MKEKIIIFIIGLLVGAVLSTGAFYIYTKISSNSNTTTIKNGQMPSGSPPEMPNKEKTDGEPPEKPTDENSDQTEKSSSSKNKKSHSKTSSSNTAESN